ncbi:YbdD/YjiX family protein [uncultured Herbaspirillum sp.]|uniref:YbdD/YjiX family protein n=1 Tax=uncultured Herbaspirillum sp. TaxID=160236 RepID=UPI0025827D37|nr:YbdD/YjiX family protein [uncultured Herbaspirillum sp.]
MSKPGALAQLLAWRRQVGRTLNLMVGMPEYDTYVAHMKHAHPELPVMTYEEFFRERQEARYGGKGRVGRCC